MCVCVCVCVCVCMCVLTGDNVPMSRTGKFLACIVFILGVLFVAVDAAIINNHFQLEYTLHTVQVKLEQGTPLASTDEVAAAKRVVHCMQRDEEERDATLPTTRHMLPIQYIVTYAAWMKSEEEVAATVTEPVYSSSHVTYTSTYT